MNKQSYIIIACAFFILSGLIFWQVRNLTLSEQLKTEIENQELQSTLLATAIEFREIERKDSETRFDSIKSRNLTKKLISQNFKKFNRNIQWAYFNGLGDPIDSLNYDVNTEKIAQSNIKVCTSCLLNISLLDEDGSNPDDKGFTLMHTPAQMFNVRGMDLNKLRYLFLYIEPKEFALSSYLLPILFLLGLTSIVIWLLVLNNKQSKLIHQKNEFVNHLSHQFQTPLSSIKLSANLMVNNANANKEELLQIIQTESGRLENHIKTVLHWVKSDADRLQISTNRISLTDVIEQSIKQMRPVFLTNKTRVNFVPPIEDWTISADNNHLQLMLFNIWENAIKHNEQPIELKIECKREEDAFLIVTTDNGVGIKNLRSDQKFKGLGLAYVNRIMQAHQGNLLLKKGDHSGLKVILKFSAHE